MLPIFMVDIRLLQCYILGVPYPPFLVSEPHIGDPDIGLVVPGSVRVYSTGVLQKTRVLHQPRVEHLRVIAVTISYKTSK